MIFYSIKEHEILFFHAIHERITDKKKNERINNNARLYFYSGKSSSMLSNKNE